MSSPEQAPQSTERGGESLTGAAAERSVEIAKSLESSGEQSPEGRAEALASARLEANETAISKERPRTETGANAADAHFIKVVATRHSRKKAYKDILTHTRAELSPASRTFSKVIHQPIIEKASNAVGSTVARPNAILFGALFALIISASVYGIAKYYGYSLSGFEAIASFCLGWVFGMIFDFIRLAVRK